MYVRVCFSDLFYLFVPQEYRLSSRGFRERRREERGEREMKDDNDDENVENNDMVWLVWHGVGGGDL